MDVEQERSDRDARLGKNQSLFREINERVESLHGKYSLNAPVEDWVCECGHDECVERIAMSRDDYEQLRQNPRRFAVAPSDEHVIPEIEVVVERRQRYWVVEKLGQSGEIAERLDPRSRARP